MNAGHPPALVIAADGGVRTLPATAPPAGLFEAVDQACATLQMRAGDWLVICSDGVTEAAGPRGEEFGHDRLVEAASRHRHRPPDVMCQAILETVESFAAGAPPADDMTVLAVRVTEPPA